MPTAIEYDWRDPHYFNEDQCNALAAAMSQVAALIAETFTHFYSREFTVTPVSITQHFAADVQDLPVFDDDDNLLGATGEGQLNIFAMRFQIYW